MKLLHNLSIQFGFRIAKIEFQGESFRNLYWIKLPIKRAQLFIYDYFINKVRSFDLATAV